MIVKTYVRKDGRVSRLMKKNPQRNRYLIELHCKHCGAMFFATRDDALTCSGRCRTARNRAIKAAQRAEASTSEQMKLL